MTSRPHLGPVALLLLLIVALIAGALWMVLGAGGDAPDADVAEPGGARPAISEPRDAVHDAKPTPREHVAAMPTDLSPDVTDAGGDAPFESEPQHSPIPPTRTVNVTVVREGDVPVRDAHVAAFSDFGSIRTDPEDAVTDIEGKVTVRVAGFNVFRVRAWTRDAAAIGERITAEPNATLDATLRLEPGHAVAGRVTSDAALAVPGATVVVRPHTDDMFGLGVSGQTNADGRFDLGSLPTRLLDVDDAHVTADARGFAATDLAFRDIGANWDNLTLTLERGQIVRGRCVTTGSVPVAGVRVTSEGIQTVQTTRDGTFELLGISRAGAGVTLLPAEHVVPPFIAIGAGTGEVDLGDIVLRAGQPISGVVVDAAERPVAGAFLHCVEQETERQVRFTQADEEGRFTLEHIGDGPHDILALAMTAGDWSSRTPAKVEGITAGTSGVRIVMSGGLTLLVAFQSESTREPVEVATAEVEVTRTDVEAARTKSAWAGPGMTSVRVTFEQPGRYLVVVKVPGYEPATLEDIEIVADRQTVINALFRSAPE